MTVIFAVIFLDEHLSLLQVAGGIFVVIGGILAVLSPARNVIQEENEGATF
jgi:drug/metabolite transporter (DMT)-like permease